MNHRLSGAMQLAVVVWVSGLAGGQTTAPEVPAAATTQPVVFSSAGAEVAIDRRTGTATSIRVGGELLTRPHPAGGDPPVGFVEVKDLRDQRTYSPLATPPATSGFLTETSGVTLSAASFIQQYQGAPFVVRQTLTPSPSGVHWEASVKLLEGQTENRSVVVSWMLPAPQGWKFWAPTDTTAVATDGVTPYRAVYGNTDFNGYGTVIPLVGLWNDRASAAVFSPPDIHKPQLTFDIYTQDIADPARGGFRSAQDLQMLRVAHQLVGLRPGRELKLAVCIAGTRPGWRAVLGHYVKTYPELFEPDPRIRKYEGCYQTINLGRSGEQTVADLANLKVTCLEIHGHFPEYGVYISPEALKDPSMTWVCRPHRAGDLSLAANRQVLRQLLDKGIAPFMYFYNVHSNAQTIQQRYPGDLMQDERGRPIIQYQGEPALRAAPDSPFGKHLLEQMDLMLAGYPTAPGFFVDNYSIQMFDFAHDDGVSMFHNRPAWDMNRNHQFVGTALFEKAHKAGKVIMVNKLSTIESARGADMVLQEGGGQSLARALGFACAYRAMFPLGWEGQRSQGPEPCLQYLLVWGGTSSGSLYGRRGSQTATAYRPLTDALIGKRWVFEDDPLTLPAGYDGQIFRIDKAAPHAGDVVVTLVNFKRSWQPSGPLAEGGQITDLSIKVRLDDADQFKTATWLAVEKSSEPPAARELVRDGRTLTVTLPLVGAAGVLRLSR